MVEEGFDEAEVLGMPLNKVSLYLESSGRQRAYRRQESFSDLVNAIGTSLSGKGFKSYLDAIGNQDG